MPLIVIKDVEWSQSNKAVIMTIPMKNARTTKKLDIMIAKKYLKIHCAPFLCELFLQGEVEEGSSRCLLQPGGDLVVILEKTNLDDFWPFLEVQGLSKDQKGLLRVEAEEQARVAANQQATGLLERWEDTAKLGAQEQIRINKEEWSQVTEARTSVTSVAMENVARWRRRVEEEQKASSTWRTPPPTEVKKKFPPLPPPPPRGVEETIEVSFTPRQFPTPKRESTDLDEQKWLQMQAE